MIFTRRTYRVAVKRSLQLERVKLSWLTADNNIPTHALYRLYYHQQVQHTARLQRRKRRERK